MDYQERLIALESAGKELHAVEMLAELEEKKAKGYYSLDEPKLYDAKQKKKQKKKHCKQNLKR